MVDLHHTCPECFATTESHTSAGWLFLTCTACDWQVRTSDPRGIQHDPQRYAVFVIPSLPKREGAVRLAGLLGKSARDLLDVADGREPLVVDAEAIEVKRLARLVAPRDLRLKTEPDFPWAMLGPDTL